MVSGSDKMLAAAASISLGVALSLLAGPIVTVSRALIADGPDFYQRNVFVRSAHSAAYPWALRILGLLLAATGIWSVMTP
jgi:hypothetical protein